MTDPQLEWGTSHISKFDPETIKDAVDLGVAKITRSARMGSAIKTPVRERTAEQAALVAVARLIADGTFV